MNHRQFGPALAASYNLRAEQYRRDDDIEARSENHHRIGGNLRRMCRSFPHAIRVLEIGCGTGRYFHWLENVKLLVGTDLSEQMLKRARQPVHGSEITAREIRLIPGNIYDMRFDPGAFDFIYCMGMFGYGAALTPEFCVNLQTWLAPGGRLYFDAIEVPPESRKDRMKRAIKRRVLPLLPDFAQRKLATRQTGVPVIRHKRHEVERAMESAGFSDFTLSSNYCHSPLWTGVHLECVARKGSAGNSARSWRALELAGADHGGL